MNYKETEELYQIVDRLISETPQNRFLKTVRGLQMDNLEFIFATDNDVIDDDFIIIKGQDDHCLRSDVIRRKLLDIYNS